jgi:DNA polymerase III alpha subunit
MIKNKFGEIVLDSDDLCDLVMQGHDITMLQDVVIDQTVDVAKLIDTIQDPNQMVSWIVPESNDISVAEFDAKQQNSWFMPQSYRDLDIAKYVLDLCQSQEQLQRVGQELLLYQERGLLDLLRYLKYLVDVMTENRVVWGVGRGSSVASYVLYLLKVHKIDSLMYDLNPREFLR